MLVLVSTMFRPGFLAWTRKVCLWIPREFFESQVVILLWFRTHTKFSGWKKINLDPRSQLRPLLVLVSVRLVVLVLSFNHLLVVVYLRLLVLVLVPRRLMALVPLHLLVLVLCRQLRRQLRRLLVRFGYSNEARDQM